MSNPQQMPQQPPMQQPPQSPMPQQMPPSGHMDHGNRPTGMTVCGIVGLVLGILAFILSFIPIINNLAFVLGLVALVLAIIGLVGTMRGKKTGKVVAIIATVLSVLSLVITLAMQSAASDAIDEAFDDSTSQQTDGTDADADADDAADDTADDADGSALTGEGDLGDVHVRIVSAERGGTDSNGDETVVVTYEWTNNTDSSTSFMATVEDTAFQNGQELDKDFYLSDSDTYDSDSQYSNVQSGATGTVTIAYVLSDDSAVSVEVSEWLSLDDSVVTQTFELN